MVFSLDLFDGILELFPFGKLCTGQHFPLFLGAIAYRHQDRKSHQTKNLVSRYHNYLNK